MTLPTGLSAAVTASVLGTANSVIYQAAVVLASQGVGFANTGSLPVTDQVSLSAVLNGSAPATVIAGIGLTPGAPGPTLLDFAHANVDPHAQTLVSLVGQALHG